MGRAGKWFRSVLASIKSPGSSPAQGKDRRSNKCNVSTSGDDSGDTLASRYIDGIDANKHAIAVAAATAAVAEAALAASKAAAEVVRLTGGGRAAPSASGDRRTVAAAVKIQSAFRAYLARRALRALKALVKLQALVRGHIVRKQSADMLHRMQAMARIQARASAHRSYPPQSPYAKTFFSNSHHPARGITNPRRYEERSNSVINGGPLVKPNHSRSGTDISANKENSEIASRWLNQWMEQCAWDKSLHKTSLDERSDKILEIDMWKPHPNSKTRNDQTTPTSYYSAWNDLGPEYTKTSPFSRPSSKHHKPNPSISSEDDQVPTRMAHNSPRVHSSSASCRPAENSRGTSFTPTMSECSRSVFGDYIGGHPSYMANTESSRAKVRSYSAPKQRMQLEGLGLSVNFGGGGFWEYSDTFSERDSFLPANNWDGNYPYSGHVKRQGTPARDPGVGFSSVYGRRM